MLKLIVLATVSLSGAALELTPDTWDQETAGKTVFLKFFAPWCGHCKAMKPAWDSLISEYADSESVLIADVDCTAAGKPLCDKNDVKGFPTIKYGDPSKLEDYKGGRDLSALKTFASELKPSCNVATLENCDNDQKTTIADNLALSEEELSAKIKIYDERLVHIEAIFEKDVKKLHQKYEEILAKKTANVAELNHETDIYLANAVMAQKQSKAEL